MADGFSALYNNTTGIGNIAVGQNAGFNLTTGNFNIDIGNGGVAGESFTIRIGGQGFQTATYIAGISGVAVAGDPVVVDSSGHLGVGTSSKRFKDEIKPIGDASEAVLALRPVTFRYKDDLDQKRITRFGLVAEDVEKVNPDLVARDAKGDDCPTAKGFRGRGQSIDERNRDSCCAPQGAGRKHSKGQCATSIKQAWAQAGRTQRTINVRERTRNDGFPAVRVLFFGRLSKPSFFQDARAPP